MPLKTGSDKSTIGKNIQEMINSGYKPQVAKAAAYNMAGKSKGKKK